MLYLILYLIRHTRGVVSASTFVRGVVYCASLLNFIFDHLDDQHAPRSTERDRASVRRPVTAFASAP